MTPTEYEHLVASVLEAEGWRVQVSPPQRDFGLDIIGEKDGHRLGVQAKMYGSGRPINAQIVTQLHGAAAFQDCDTAMIATDGRVLQDAAAVATKIGIEVRIIPAVHRTSTDQSKVGSIGRAEETFDEIWTDHVMPLEGHVLTRPNGKTNEVVSVDWSGIRQRSSQGNVRSIDIEIFRWTIERLIDGETVSRSEINAQYPKRASSGIMLVICSLPMFESVRIGSKTGVRRVDRL